MRAETGKSAFWKLAAVAGLTAVVVSGCHRSAGVFTTAPGGPSGGSAHNPTGPGAVATEPGTGVSVPLGPDPQITPGATLPVTKDDICVSGYSQKVRNVPDSVKRQAYGNYGIATHQPGEFEVDHLISLELGGSNSIKNLWPESYKSQPWNAHVKDKLENALHADVCSGRTDLKTAQQEIATDWIGAYKKEFGAGAPGTSGDGASRHRGRPAAFVVPGNQTAAAVGDASAPAGQVWVNLGSGKYFFRGAKYYGKTKRGEYLSEADAKAQGYTAAQGQGERTQ